MKHGNAEKLETPFSAFTMSVRWPQGHPVCKRSPSPAMQANGGPNL